MKSVQRCCVEYEMICKIALVADAAEAPIAPLVGAVPFSAHFLAQEAKLDQCCGLRAAAELCCHTDSNSR